MQLTQTQADLNNSTSSRKSGISATSTPKPVSKVRPGGGLGNSTAGSALASQNFTKSNWSVGTQESTKWLKSSPLGAKVVIQKSDHSDTRDEEIDYKVLGPRFEGMRVQSEQKKDVVRAGFGDVLKLENKLCLVHFP